jgi:AraC-like DNA-binding protein/mannose-6-phosphate isomerase-like protein (cupin superfamily)
VNTYPEPYYARSSENFEKTGRPWDQHFPLDPSFPFHIIGLPEGSYPRHWHRYLEIMYLMEGSFQVVVDNQHYTLDSGDIVMVNPDILHEYSNPADGKTQKALVFLFSLELLSGDLDDFNEKNGKRVFAGQTVIRAKDGPPAYKKIVRLLLSMYKEYSKKAPGWKLAIKRNVYDLFLVFLRSMPRPEQKASEKNISLLLKHDETLERIFSWLYAHYSDPELTLEKAAQAAYFSKYYFSKFFRKKTGVTFKSWLTHLRIAHARDMLLDSDKTITDIAYACGFDSLKTFYRQFKIFCNMSPSDLRRIENNK